MKIATRYEEAYQINDEVFVVDKRSGEAREATTGRLASQEEVEAITDCEHRMWEAQQISEFRTIPGLSEEEQKEREIRYAKNAIKKALKTMDILLERIMEDR